MAKSKSSAMDEEEVQSLMHGIVADCVSYDESELSPDRVKATEYYLGKPFGDEEEGRSQVVLTQVRDGVQGVLPSFLRVFFGPERAVEFVPRTAAQVEAAAQATDYVQYVFAEENGGFLKTHAVLKDGLVRKLGIFKWGWDDSATQKAYRLHGVTQAELEELAADDDVTLVSVTEDPPEEAAEAAGTAGAIPGTPQGTPLLPAPGAPQMPQGDPQMPGMAMVPAPAAPEPTFTVELTYHSTEGVPRIWTVPPEELLVSREARTPYDALFIGHRMEKTAGELIALGVDEDDVEEYAGEDNSLRQTVDDQARRTDASGFALDPEAGQANNKTLFVEGYARIDVDGDGIAELRLIWMLGPNYQIVKNVPTDEVPFSVFCPDPEPHTLIGQSWADRLMDVQRVTSSITRSTLDSLAASIFPRTAYVEGQVSVEDILNTAIGAPIRMRTPGAIQPFAHDFVGREALPILAFFDDVAERRTGQNKGAIGLDADALQSSTQSAVGAAVTAAQAQTEMLARIFAETTLKPLFRGILKMLVKHQPRAKMTRLRGKWVSVDPRVWDADMDVSVNVALGSGLVETKVQTLIGIAAKMEQIMATMGPTNPFFTAAQYSHVLKKIVELQGYKNTSEFFSDVPADWQPPVPPAPPPSPEQVIAQAQLQIEHMKSQRELAIKEAELELKRQTLLFEHERALADAAATNELKRYELELKYHAEISGKQLDADVARERHSVDTTLAVQQQGHAQAVAEHQEMLAEQQQAHDQQMAEAQAAQQAQQAASTNEAV